MPNNAKLDLVLAKDILIPIAAIVMSAVVAVCVAWFTTTYTLRKQELHGKVRLGSLCHRYLANFVSAYDSQTRCLRTDELAYRLYTEELKYIVDDLHGLLGNPYVDKLLLEYPQTSTMMVLLRRELIEHTSHGTPLRAMNAQSLREVFRLWEVIRADSQISRGNDEFDRAIRQLEKTYRDSGVFDVTPKSSPPTGTSVPPKP